MKQINQIKNEIEQLLSELKHEKSKTHISRIGKQLEFKKLCIWYLQENPTEKSLEKQLTQRENHVANFETRTAGVSGSALTSLAKESDIPLIKQQIKTLKYILNHDTKRSS